MLLYELNPDRINRLLDIAETYSEKSGCLRRKYGAVLHSEGLGIISTGCNNSPIGTKSCSQLGFCVREDSNVPRGTRYELCRSVHAEQNCIISASPSQLKDSTLFLVGKESSNNEYVKNPEPCIMCKRFIINAGIKSVICRINKSEYKEYFVKDWINDEGFIIDTYSKIVNEPL